MRSIIIAILLLFSLPNIIFSNEFSFEFIELDIKEFTGLHSFAHAVHMDRIILVGGRKDGLHRRQPWAAFLAEDNNNKIIIIDTKTNEVDTIPLSILELPYSEQFASTNPEYCQIDNILYFVGGYGYSPTEDEHITYPYLTSINLDLLLDAIHDQQKLKKAFNTIEDNRLRVTGGYINELNGFFYLIGGQNFEGRYNPMGPDHGPGFKQEYTNEIRKFKLNIDNNVMSITDYTSIRDTLALHRRDFNVMETIYPDGNMGFIGFSGVFQYEQDLPWLNIVNIYENDYKLVDDFEQKFNHYHTAHVGIYDSETESIHYIFWGGISQFYIDDLGQLIDDKDVPFVKTISMVSRNHDGIFRESIIGQMSDYLGTGAEFVVSPDLLIEGTSLIDFSKLKKGKNDIGYFIGGIKSNSKNIFFENTGIQSSASNKIFKVILNLSLSYIENNRIDSKPYIQFNKDTGLLDINLNADAIGLIVNIFTLDGQMVFEKKIHQNFNKGEQIQIALEGISKGLYVLRFSVSDSLYFDKLLIK